VAKEGGGWGAYMAKGGPLRPLWPKEREGRPPLTKGGGPVWPKEGWPSPPTGGTAPLAIPHLRGAYMAKEGGRGALRPPLAIPHLRGAYMAIPSGWGGPYGQKRDGHPFGQTPPFGPDGQKSVWPSLWPSPTGWVAPLRPKGAGGGPLPTA
jgi:hypothetical protein